jgi:hypothetical protein
MLAARQPLLSDTAAPSRLSYKSGILRSLACAPLSASACEVETLHMEALALPSPDWVINRLRACCQRNAQGILVGLELLRRCGATLVALQFYFRQFMASLSLGTVDLRPPCPRQTSATLLR